MRLLAARIVVISLCTAVVHAHHSISAVYDFAQPVKLEGVVTAFHFVTRTCDPRLRRPVAAPI
jgi:hypothetical protein